MKKRNVAGRVLYLIKYRPLLDPSYDISESLCDARDRTERPAKGNTKTTIHFITGLSSGLKNYRTTSESDNVRLP